MMYDRRHISRFVALSLFFLLIFTQIGCSPTPLKSIDAPQGGKIVYGVVEGANTEAAAMGNVLRSVHNSCGERPQIGRVFKVRGTDSHAVFFTVVNHPGGNKYVAGLVIASQSGPGRVEAAMVSDDASRFGSTINPMLQQLFSVWHPGEASAAPVPAASEAPSALIPSMHTVVLSDNTASVSIPDGWRVDPKSYGGGMFVFGPRGERVHINMWVGADDPNGPGMRRLRQTRIRPNPQRVIYPVNTDLSKDYPDVLQRIRVANGLQPTELRVTSVEPVQAAKGIRCVKAQGQVNPDGSGMQEFIDILCATSPNQYGSYNFQSSGARLPVGTNDQTRATALAIINSFQINMQLVKQRADADAAPVLAAMQRNYAAQQQQWMARHQQIVGNIKQIGANATARYNATQAANDAQHKSWNNQQDINSRNVQGFSNYLLDQTVVQDNYRNTHSTEWNRTADTLVKVNPNRYEIVENPNYWKGADF